jgi:hypothetical protein
MPRLIRGSPTNHCRGRQCSAQTAALIDRTPWGTLERALLSTQTLEAVTLALKFLGKDPDSDHDGSPTIYLDEETNEYVLQGWIVDAATIAEINGIRPIPEGELVIRFPKRMMPFFPEVTGDQHPQPDNCGNADDGIGDS